MERHLKMQVEGDNNNYNLGPLWQSAAAPPIKIIWQCAVGGKYSSHIAGYVLICGRFTHKTSISVAKYAKGLTSATCDLVMFGCDKFAHHILLTPLYTEHHQQWFAMKNRQRAFRAEPFPTICNRMVKIRTRMIAVIASHSGLASHIVNHGWTIKPSSTTVPTSTTPPAIRLIDGLRALQVSRWHIARPAKLPGRMQLGALQ